MNYASTMDKKLYLCTQKRARTGCTSAIQTSLIALGLHRPCRQVKAIWRLMPPDVRESGVSPELYLQL